MTYEKIFKEVQKAFLKADTKAITADFAFQFNITGEGEGIFYAAFKNGKLSVEPYDYNDRDVLFTADGETFIAIANGKVEPIEAFKEGKLSFEGDQELAKQIMFLIAEKPSAKKKPAAKKETAKPDEKEAEAPAENPENKPENKEEKPAEKSNAKASAKAAEAKPANKKSAEKAKK